MDTLDMIIRKNIDKLEKWIEEETKDPNTSQARLDALDRNMDWMKRELFLHLLWQQDLIDTKILPKGLPKDMEKEHIRQGYKRK